MWSGCKKENKFGHSHKVPKEFISYSTSLILISSKITQKSVLAHLASYRQSQLADLEDPQALAGRILFAHRWYSCRQLTGSILQNSNIAF